MYSACCTPAFLLYRSFPSETELLLGFLERKLLLGVLLCNDSYSETVDKMFLIILYPSNTLPYSVNAFLS